MLLVVHLGCEKRLLLVSLFNNGGNNDTTFDQPLVQNGSRFHGSSLPAVWFLQSQASSTNMGSQLAEAESLLQKQDLLETQVSALGDTIAIISSTAIKVGKPLHQSNMF